MASYTTDYSKWDNFEDSDEEPEAPVVNLRPRGKVPSNLPPGAVVGTATVKGNRPSSTKEGDSNYSVEMGSDGPCVVDNGAAAAPAASSNVPYEPFETKMCWQNNEQKTFVQIAIPEATKKNEVVVDFGTSSVTILLKGMQPVKLPHPDVKAPLCQWTLSRKEFHGSKAPQLCIHMEFMKEDEVLWPQNTFGGGGPEPLSSSEEIEAAWMAQPSQGPSPDPKNDTWTGEYTWLQENERIMVWFDVPDTPRAKNMVVKCTSTQLTVELYVDTTLGRYVRTLSRPVKADEMEWQFDDDIPGRRRLKVELVMEELASWENGPFVMEEPANKGYCQTTTVVDNATGEKTDLPAAAPATVTARPA